MQRLYRFVAYTAPWLVAFHCAVGAAFAGEPEREEEKKQAEARALHQRGATAYDLGNFDEAIAAFRAAYELSPAPGLLFNLAQAYRGKGKEGCADALRTYKAYLRAAPDASNRDVASEQISEMDRCVKAQAEANAAPPAPNEPPAQSPDAASTPPTWPAVLLGVTGLAALGIGTGLNVSAHAEFDNLEAQCPAHDCDPADWEPYQLRENVSFGMFGVGAALVVGGAIYWVITATTQSSGPTKPGPVRASFHRGVTIAF
ncbi:MAG: tetratricopeptide repeat protein [Polyangiaceae bacterium]|nr:tetratricopeptide repeat protein [Polyangiaceae bacterium]